MVLVFKILLLRTSRQQSFQIQSPVFSREFTILDDQETEVADFYRISNFFSSPAYQIVNQTNAMTMEELIAVVMGVNAIEKRKNSSGAANSGGS
ncbi:hypothetical protein [Gracilibacillus massiliensis]|uniref:hypothetical protein n=1 Tax=Gracilibacillus massiliensis TaxID=1564956 RepID=UPI00071CA9F1|nr:hypothetical protein [Gracilibacillus massiliensis]